MPSRPPLPPPVAARTAAARILVVEDRSEVRDVLRRTLDGSGYEVHTAVDGEQGLRSALDLVPDLVILDVGLPKRNGFEVATELRARGFGGPVLMLTARVAVHDRVQGLEAGADDYLAKPFDYDELLARVKALLRRATFQAEQSTLRLGSLALDPLTRDVSLDNVPVTLTQKEYALLEYFMRHAEIVITREQLAEHVWKTPFDETSNIADVYVNYLRKKLDGAGRSPVIHTIRGVGYVLRAPEATGAPGRQQ